MRRLPFENYRFISKLSKDEILLRLNDLIEPETFFRFDYRDTSKYYKGKLVGNKFYIMRIIDYRNSFQPKIIGKIQEGPDGIVIYIKMRLQYFVMVFMLLWCCFPLVAFMAYLISSINDIGNILAALMAFGMLLIAYKMTMKGFKLESNKSKATLFRILEGQ
jgi:hypothetical protein